MDNFDLSFQCGDITFLYRVTALIVHKRKLLVVSHIDHPDLYYTVGGRVHAGETSQEAVLREVVEETGVVMEIDRLRFVGEQFFEMQGAKYHLVSFYYQMKYDDKTDIANGKKTDQNEESLHWIAIDDLISSGFEPAFLPERLLEDSFKVEHIIHKG